MTLGQMQKVLRPVLIAVAAGDLGAGLVRQWRSAGAAAAAVRTAATLPVLAVLGVEIVTTLRRGDFGLDIVAALSMAVALGLRRNTGGGGGGADVCRRGARACRARPSAIATARSRRCRSTLSPRAIGC